MIRSTLLAVTLLALLAGCRREDVRDFTLEIPSLAETNKALVVDCLQKYNGVIKDSFAWDLQKKTLTLRYDSMQIAKENIRQAIEAKGFAVTR